MNDRNVVVVGGGISGLSAAFDLHRAGWSVTVLEAGDRWGGKIQTSPVGDGPVDAGPDAFLARVDDGHRLCVDLSLDAELTSPVSPVPAYIYADDRLHELPTGTILGVPTALGVLERSTLISADGVARAAADLTMDSSVLNPDPSVGAICRERLGDEVTELLIDPLIGGINASDIDRLSLAAATPQLAGALRDHRSLIEGMAAFQQAGAAMGSRDPDQPVFYGLPGGIGRIIDRLVDELAEADLRLNTPVLDLTAFSDADAIVLAVPAFAAAAIIEATVASAGSDLPPGSSLELAAAGAATELRSIDYADVSQVVVEVPIAGLDRILDASGILFPRVGGTVLTACTWLSTKWDHYKRPNSVLLRLSSGRFGDDRHATLSDHELVATLLKELSAVIPVTAPPLATRIKRWSKAFPQYTPGHNTRVATARGFVTELDARINLVGAPYDGIGVPACIRGGRALAERLTQT